MVKEEAISGPNLKKCPMGLGCRVEGSRGGGGGRG